MSDKEIDMEEIKAESENYGDEISRVAYTYWETRGCVDGHDVEDWLMAEQEVLRRHSTRPAQREEGRRSAISSAA